MVTDSPAMRGAELRYQCPDGARAGEWRCPRRRPSSFEHGSERVSAGKRVVEVVVVGGGAAGCVVASRLSESGARSVLLLEAGPDLRADTPDEIRDGWRITRAFDWGYTSEPDARGVVQNLWRN